MACFCKLFIKKLFSPEPNFHISILDRTIYVSGSNGTLLSPFYPNPYLIKEFAHSSLTFHVEVPRGHVLLNFTEVELSGVSYTRDFIDIFDGKTTSAERLWRIQAGKPEKLPAIFLGSSNHLTVRFGSFSQFNTEKLYRFKAAYTTIINGNFLTLYPVYPVFVLAEFISETGNSSKMGNSSKTG